MDDFINTLRGSDSERGNHRQSNVKGKLYGELGAPTFPGHVHLFNANYGAPTGTEAEGDLTYSPSEFHLARAHARRGNSTAQFHVGLTLDEWSFYDDSDGTSTPTLLRTPTEGIQQMFGWSVPVKDC